MATVTDEDRACAQMTVQPQPWMPGQMRMDERVAEYRERIEARMTHERCERVNELEAVIAKRDKRTVEIEAARENTLNSLSIACAKLGDANERIAELEAHDDSAHDEICTHIQRIAALEAKLNATESARDKAIDKVIDMGKRITDLEACANAIERKRAEAHELAVQQGKRIKELDSNAKSAWKSYHKAADERDSLWTRLVRANGQLAAAESARDHAISFQAANVSRCERLEDALEKAERALADAKPVLTAEERGFLNAWRGAPQLTRTQEALQTAIKIIDRLCPPPKAPPSDAELADMLLNASESPGSMGTPAAVVSRKVADALRARGAK